MPRDADQRLNALARVQHGAFTRSQALRCGIPSSTLHERVGRGVYEELQEGVYRHAAVPDAREARLLAAVLVAGGEAVLSHTSAAAHHRLEGSQHPSVIHILVSDRQLQRPRHTRVHRSIWLPDEHRTIHDAIPVTVVARTLCDAAQYVPRGVLRRMVADALRRRLTSVEELLTIIDALGRPRGATTLRSILTQISPQVARTRTEIEALYLRVNARGGLPPPVMNHPIRDAYGERRYLDAAYVPQRVGVELDSEDFHTAPLDLVEDRKRQNAILLAGWRTLLRYTWWDLTHEPTRVVSEVRRALAA